MVTPPPGKGLFSCSPHSLPDELGHKVVQAPAQVEGTSRPGSWVLFYCFYWNHAPAHQTLQTSRLVAAKFIQTLPQESGRYIALSAAPAFFFFAAPRSLWNLNSLTRD